MLNIYKLLLISSLFKISWCCQGRLYEQKTRSDIDYTTKFICTWLVVIYDKDQGERFGIAYGSIIHPKVVLTTAVDLNTHDIEKLYVLADCDADVDIYFGNCTTRYVDQIIYSDDQKSFALLIMQTAFDITPVIKPISLTNSMDLVYGETCMVYHWQRFYDERYDIYGVAPRAYHLPYVDGKFNVDAMNVDQIKNSRDYIIREDFFYPLLMVDILALNFFGSPLVCLLKNNDNVSHSIPTQVGIAILNFQLTYPADELPILTDESPYLITDFYNEIMEKLKGIVD